MHLRLTVHLLMPSPFFRPHHDLAAQVSVSTWYLSIHALLHLVLVQVLEWHQFAASIAFGWRASCEGVLYQLVLELLHCAVLGEMFLKKVERNPLLAAAEVWTEHQA